VGLSTARSAAAGKIGEVCTGKVAHSGNRARPKCAVLCNQTTSRRAALKKVKEVIDGEILVS
jgi:hypothetical protein